MASTIILLVVILILANLLIITLLLLKTGKVTEKVEMLCDTFEKSLENGLEDSTARTRDIVERMAETEDHLRTISKNVYIIASKIVKDVEEQKSD